MRRMKTNRRLVYRIRRAKFAIASIAFVVSCTLLFIAERPASAPWIWLVAGIYIVSGMWLVIRFAPRDEMPDDSSPQVRGGTAHSRDN